MDSVIRRLDPAIQGFPGDHADAPLALVCAGLIGLMDGTTPPTPAIAAEYRQAQAASGRTPADQIRLALWCEAHGLTAERLRHLALAVLADPANATIGKSLALRNDYIPVVDTQLQIPIGQMMVESQRSAVVAQAQLTNDAAGLDRLNATIHQNNEPVLLALGDITGEHYGEDPGKWSRWWVNEQGYAITDSSTTTMPTIVEDVPIGYTPTAAPVVAAQFIGYAHPRHSCFGAGTPVRTIDGTRRIEQIRRGDPVLTQDTISGALTYQPVLTAYHNPPSSTYRVKLGEDEVVATGIHRFWKAGTGWTMARDLKVGDSLRVLGGVAPVVAVEPNQTQPVFNLEVADGRSFFVGQVGALVHDNSLVEATSNPFDAAGSAGPMATAAGSPR